MPLPALALGLLSLAPKLFDLFDGDDDSTAGKVADLAAKTARAVTGRDDDDAALQALQSDPALAAAYQEQVYKHAETVFGLQNDRLEIEQGLLTGETLEQFSQKTRDKIGELRMTTRPVVVRRMSHVMLLPVYVFLFDGAMTVVNSLLAYAFNLLKVDGDIMVPSYQVPLLASTLFGEDSVYIDLYTPAATAATTIVVGWMTMREVGKAGGPKKIAGNAWAGVAGAAGKVWDAVRR